MIACKLGFIAHGTSIYQCETNYFSLIRALAEPYNWTLLAIAFAHGRGSQGHPALDAVVHGVLPIFNFYAFFTSFAITKLLIIEKSGQTSWATS